MRPGVLAVTADAVVVESARPVVPLDRWLVDVVVRCAESAAHVQLVTGPTALLTPLASATVAQAGRWVVDHPDGAYDGHTGEVLVLGEDRTWQGTTAAAPLFVTRSRDPDLLRPALTVAVTVDQPAARSTVLGGVTEDLLRHVTGQAPAGWGVAEPASETWDAAELTAFVQRRLPTPSRLVVVGADRASSVMLKAARTDRVQEDLTAYLRLPDAVARLDQAGVRDWTVTMLSALAAAGRVAFALAWLRRGRDDLLEPAAVHRAPEPIAMVIGPRGVRDLHRDTVEALPLSQPPVAVGRPRLPSLVQPLGSATTTGWQDFAAVFRHLDPEALRRAAPDMVPDADAGPPLGG